MGQVCDYRNVAENGNWTAIGERVRRARLSAGLSQAALGERMSLDRTMIAKVEAGTRRVDALELTRLAAVLDVPLDYLLEPQPTAISHHAELITEDSDTETARRPQRVEVAVSRLAPRRAPGCRHRHVATRPAGQLPGPGRVTGGRPAGGPLAARP